MNHLREYRKSAGLTQAKLGAKSHLTQNRVAMLEYGHVLPWPREADALSVVLGVPPEAIFPEGYKVRCDYGKHIVAEKPYTPEEPTPLAINRPLPREFWAPCKKCGFHLHFRTDDRHTPFDSELECPSCAMPIRDIIPLPEAMNV
jgi:transcriptional regulator with XRE-family HTH domain